MKRPTNRPATYDITRDTAEFKRVVRASILSILQDVAARDWESAAGKIEPAPDLAVAPTKEEWARVLEKHFAAYFAARERFRLDPEGRAAKHTYFSVDTDQGVWEVTQVLVDPADQNDWQFRLRVPLATSRAENRAILQWQAISLIGQ